MRKHDWKIVSAVVLLAIIVFMIFGQLYNQTQYKKLIEKELDYISYTLLEYIDMQTEYLEDITNSFYFPDIDNLSNMTSDEVEKYLSLWVESTKGITEGYLISKDRKVYAYSTNEISTDKKDIIKVCRFEYTKETDEVVLVTNKKDDYETLLLTKALYDSNQMFAGAICFEYDIRNFNSIFEKVNIYSDKLDLVLRDTYGNVIYRNNKFKEEEKVIDENEDVFDKNISEEAKVKTVREIIAPDNNIFSMDGKTLLSRFSSSYLEKPASEESTYFSCEGIAEKTGMKLTTSIDINEACYNYETRQIAMLFVYAIIVFVYAIWAIVTRNNVEKKRLYFVLFTIVVSIFVGYFIIETIVLNKVYDKYLDVQGNIVSATIAANRKNDENYGALIAKIIPGTCLVVDRNDYSKGKGNYTLQIENIEEHLSHTEIRNLLFKIMNNVEGIKQLDIISSDRVILSYPEVANNTFDILGEYAEYNAGSVSHITQINDDGNYVIYYSITFEAQKTDYTVAVTFADQDYNEITEDNDIVVGKYKIAGNTIVNKETGNTIKTDIDLSDSTNTEEFIISKAYEQLELRGLVAIKNTLASVPIIVSIKIENIYVNLMSSFVIALTFICTVSILSLYIFLRLERKKLENKLDVSSEAKALDRLVKKIEHDIVIVNEAFGIAPDDDD